MKFRNMSKFLTGVLLLTNLNIDSFAGTLSEDGRYETFVGSSIAINDILEEDKINIKIEGSTLVNHIDYSNLFDSRNNNITINQDNKEIFFDNTNNNINENYTDSALYCKPMLKANETYTVIFDIIENTISGEQYFRVLDNHNKYMPIETMAIEDNRTGIVKAKFTVKENNNGTFKIYLRNPNNQQNRGTIKIKNLMILDGDWTNKDIPNYFEGLKSSFEDELITQQMVSNGEESAENLGKYKVEVKTTGKNIFDENMDVSIYNKDWTKVSNGFTINTQTNYMSDWYYLNLKPNTQYVLSANTDAWIRLYYGHVTGHGDGEYHIGAVSGGLPSRVFTTDNTGYITLRLTNELKLGESYIKNIQLEEGSISTEYEPYKESVNTFYLNSPLLKGDTIEYINSQAYHVRRRESVTLDGSTEEEWNYCDIVNPTIQVSTPIKNGSIVDDYDVISDKILPYYGEIKDSIWVNNSNIHIRLELSKLTEGTVDGFREWIINNPITVLYNLAKPIYEPIKADLSVNLFEGVTHISNNSNIPTNMKVIVDRTINRAVEAIELFKVTPTTENLSKARMWVNLLDESIKKDELQSEINSITGLEDMVLERKSATANLDVYVMCENMLSMSLNTNNITFDNYSGVEDMEKINALEISINSSLPYDLNAYLQTEIKGSENSNIMDIDILKIKDNSKDNYQSFANTTDKVILNEDCSSGNYISHNIDLKLESSNAYSVDVYKTTIKFEAVQK